MERVKTFFQKTHVGLWIFLFLQVIVLIQFANGEQDVLFQLLAIYILSVLISLTPIGEFCLCVFARAWGAPRSDMRERMEWLLEDIVNDVKEKSPGYAGKIQLRIINVDEPYVCALGRKTIAFSPNFLELPEDEQRGLLASEVAHLVLRHNVWMMLAGCSNPLFLFMWLMLQCTKLLFMVVGFIYCLFTRSNLHRFVSMASVAITNLFVRLWTGLCMLFIYFENRQNVYVADRYAADIGYGFELARGIDDLRDMHIQTGLLGSLFQSKPHPDARINSLIEYGVPYRGY